jgi:energy-coupling factor transport system ATP-binding protein
MKIIEIDNLKFSYLGQTETALEIEHLSISEGESVLITGKSGSGKSTLIQCINGIIPHVTAGILTGNVRLKGEDVSGMSVAGISTIVGTLLQDPERQVLNYKVVEEVAFGPENLNCTHDEIERRIHAATKRTGIEDLMERDTDTLSGGEMQRVALTSVMAMEPEILVLDEPTSNIDPEGTEKIFQFLHQQKGVKTLLVVEHKVERALRFVDRIIVIDSGRIVLDIPKENMLEMVHTLLEKGIEIPEEFLYASKLGLKTADIDAVREETQRAGITFHTHTRRNGGDLVLEAQSMVRVPDRIIVDATLKARKGTVVAIMGKNGAGKSTFLKAMLGLLNKNQFTSSSSIKIDNLDLSRSDISKRGAYISYLPQSFDLMLINRTVEREVKYSMRKRGIWNDELLQTIFEIFELYEIRAADPLRLSMGQRRRVSMASILASEVRIVLMDEPTSGQDFYHKDLMGKELRKITGMGYTVIVVTHDARFVYRYADELAIMHEGKIVFHGIPEEGFEISGQYGILPPSDHLLRRDAKKMEAQ